MGNMGISPLIVWLIVLLVWLIMSSATSAERLEELSAWVLIGRLLLASALGALIGLQRELTRNVAGLRTHLLVSLGACCVMLTSQYGFLEDPNPGDPARMAAQVVSGIGFLGAGAIMRRGPEVSGLTTAASLWVSAAIGLAIGTGFWIAAVSTTVLTLVSLVVLKALERRFISTRNNKVISIVDVTWDQVQRVMSMMAEESIIIRSIRSEVSPTPVPVGADPLVNVELFVKLPKSMGGTLATLSTIITSAVPQLERKTESKKGKQVHFDGSRYAATMANLSDSAIPKYVPGAASTPFVPAHPAIPTIQPTEKEEPILGSPLHERPTTPGRAAFRIVDEEDLATSRRSRDRPSRSRLSRRSSMVSEMSVTSRSTHRDGKQPAVSQSQSSQPQPINVVIMSEHNDVPQPSSYSYYSYE